MKHLTSVFFLITALILVASCNPDSTKTIIPDDKRAAEISELKFGMFICWSFSTFYGEEWTPTLDKDASFFRATGCDTDQWCKTAKDAGMSYILFLTKHHDGFCLWDTETTDKKVTNSPLELDVLAKLRKPRISTYRILKPLIGEVASRRQVSSSGINYRPYTQICKIPKIHNIWLKVVELPCPAAHCCCLMAWFPCPGLIRRYFCCC